MAKANKIKAVDRLFMGKVIESVCIACGCNREQVFQKSRKPKITQRRYLFVITCINYKPHWVGKYNAIGAYLNLDHSTIIHSEVRAREMLKTNDVFADTYNQIRMMMDGHLCDPMMEDYQKQITALRSEVRQRDRSIQKLMERVRHWKNIAEGNVKLFGQPKYN
jgi:hypothetical protein